MDTRKIKDRAERKKLKREARKKQAPKARGIGVCVSAAGKWNPGGQLRIAKSCQTTSDGGEKKRNANGRTRAGPPGHSSRLAPVQDHAQERGVEKGFHLQRLACGNR